MIPAGDYSVTDIKNLLLTSKRSITLGLGYQFKYKDEIVEFVGVEDSIVFYDTLTSEPIRKFGIFYSFKIIESNRRRCSFLIEHGKIKPNEWERLK